MKFVFECNECKCELKFTYKHVNSMKLICPNCKSYTDFNFTKTTSIDEI